MDLFFTEILLMKKEAMNQIEVRYDKKFLKEKRKFKRKCTSIENDFKRFEIALKIKIIDNNFKVPVDNKKICRIEGLQECVTLPAFVYCEKMNRGRNSVIRITFIYDPLKKIIYFVQFYFKGNDEVENKNRINKLFK